MTCELWGSTLEADCHISSAVAFFEKISSIQLDMHIAFGKKHLKDLGGASIFSGSSLALRKNLLIDPVGFDQPPCLAILYLPHY